VVTGGSRGIGRAIVHRLAADGATVVFNFARSTDQAAEVEQAVRDAGGRAHGVRADLAAPDAVGQLMAAVGEHCDSLDILVNNAAMEFAPAPLADIGEEIYDAVMAVNARSVFLTMPHAARTMADNGRIINISTLNATRSAPGSAAYVASKGRLSSSPRSRRSNSGSAASLSTPSAPGQPTPSCYGTLARRNLWNRSPC
jgi:3-oxoacyl-[acyl-carrier protein] reductase